MVTIIFAPLIASFAGLMIIYEKVKVLFVKPVS